MASLKCLERAVVLPLKTPASVKSNDKLVFGSIGTGSNPSVLICGIALMNATDAFGNIEPYISVDREGAYNLPVEGEFGCPLVLHAFRPGDPVYADINGPGGSYDSTTNCWTGFVLNGNAGGVLWGYVLDAVPAGAGTTVVRVAFK